MVLRRLVVMPSYVKTGSEVPTTLATEAATRNDSAVGAVEESSTDAFTCRAIEPDLKEQFGRFEARRKGWTANAAKREHTKPTGRRV